MLLKVSLVVFWGGLRPNGTVTTYLCARATILPLLMIEYECSDPSYTQDVLYHQVLSKKPMGNPQKHKMTVFYRYLSRVYK